MNARAAPTLFQQALGAAYYSLAPCVRRLHGIRGQARYVGVATIECGNNPLARICARIAGLPAEARTLLLLPYAMTAYVMWRAKEAGFRLAAEPDRG